MRHVLIFIVSAYRYLLSPWLGQNCRFYPSCSCYAQEALRQHGALTGAWMTIKRIARCQPWHSGGYDPVPLATESTSVRTSTHDHTGNCSHG